MTYTNEQIKKALECCTCHPAKCVDICPRYGDGEESWCECRWELMLAALALINRQEAEIAELQRKIASYKSEIENLKLEMLYMENPNTIGDSHEMGCW